MADCGRFGLPQNGAGPDRAMGAQRVFRAGYGWIRAQRSPPGVARILRGQCLVHRICRTIATCAAQADRRKCADTGDGGTRAKPSYRPGEEPERGDRRRRRERNRGPQDAIPLRGPSSAC